MNATNARAFALTRRPLGKNAHRSIDGSDHLFFWSAIDVT